MLDFLTGSGEGSSFGGGDFISSAIDHYEANRQRGWAKQMDNTKYFRAVRDLKNAGLNPMLAVGGGIKGGTPSGVAASGAASAYNQSKLIRAQTQLMNSQTAKTKQEKTNLGHIEKSVEAFGTMANLVTQFLKESGGDQAGSSSAQAFKWMRERLVRDVPRSLHWLERDRARKNKPVTARLPNVEKKLEQMRGR